MFHQHLANSSKTLQKLFRSTSQTHHTYFEITSQKSAICMLTNSQHLKPSLLVSNLQYHLGLINGRSLPYSSALLNDVFGWLLSAVPITSLYIIGKWTFQFQTVHLQTLNTTHSRHKHHTSNKHHTKHHTSISQTPHKLHTKHQSHTTLTPHKHHTKQQSHTTLTPFSHHAHTTLTPL